MCTYPRSASPFLVGRAVGGAEIGKADVIFEASGLPVRLATALQSVARGGTVVPVGLLPSGSISAPANLIVSKHLNVGSFRFTAAEFNDAIAPFAGRGCRAVRDRVDGHPVRGRGVYARVEPWGIRQSPAGDRQWMRRRTESGTAP
jgi:hypothetical protein